MSALPKNWRERIPSPDEYFSSAVPTLTRANVNGWAQGRCPFHDDGNASLSVNLRGDKGRWRCFASCGGGDLIGFHMKLRGLEFNEAIRDLLRGGR